MKLITDGGNGIAYLDGKCKECRHRFLLPFHGAEGKYKCPKCKQIFKLRRKK